MINDPIRDFILESEKNLQVASAVNEAWQNARKEIVDNFLNRLEKRLKKTLKDWNSERDYRPLVDKWAWFAIGKPAWGKQFKVALGFENFAKRMVFGVLRGTESTPRRPLSPEVVGALQKHESFRSAISLKWWEAKLTMRSPAPDWSKPEVLWRLYKDPSFLEEVVEHLVAVAGLCEPIVDRLVRKK